MPRPIDMAKVEAVKALSATGLPNTKIAKQVGVNEKTIRRWLEIEDTPEQASALQLIRDEQKKKYAKDAWDIIHEANSRLKKALKAGEVKGKDLAIVQGIYADKLMALDAKSGPQNKVGAIHFHLTASDSPVEPDTTVLPPITSPVQGDGVRGGGGQDLLRLPRSCEDRIGNEVRRDDSVLDVQEPSRLCAADDNGGTVG